ncbi:MAG: hypothetical protein Q9201_004586 [Fulgogasparrea decipioides]
MAVTIIALAIAASNADVFSGMGCSVPSKLGYNIAAAVLSFIVLLVLILATGPKPGLRVIPWFIWGQLGLDVFMFIIWIAAAGVSQYDCNDLCNACSGASEVWTSGLYCYCYYISKRDQSPAPRGLAKSIEERGYHHRGLGSSRVAGKTALDSIMVVLFAFTTAMTVFWIFKTRRSGTEASTTTQLAPQPTPQAGTLGTTPTTGTYPEKTGASFTHEELQAQPQMQQPGYPEPNADSQQPVYPTSGPQGAAGEYYNQPQSQPQQIQYPPNHVEMQSHLPGQQIVSPVVGH